VVSTQSTNGAAAFSLPGVAKLQAISNFSDELANFGDPGRNIPRLAGYNLIANPITVAEIKRILQENIVQTDSDRRP
jgi:hypothetical protein